MKDEALRLALEALEKNLESLVSGVTHSLTVNAITAIQQALEQPEPEPVGYLYVSDPWGAPEYNFSLEKENEYSQPLYTSPPNREWQGLTNAEFAEILCDDRWQNRPELMMLQVQAKLKERNHDQ